VAPDRPGWFANNDTAQFIRAEDHAGRSEWVMADTRGPGAIVRIWMGAPKPEEGPLGTIRIYLDGATTPAVEEVADRLLSGESFVGPPLAAVRSIGRNLYLPIPYARHAKVTYDRNSSVSKKPEDRAWYHVGYRTYPKGTRVSSFSMAELERARAKLDAVQKILAAVPETPRGVAEAVPVTRRLGPGETAEAAMKGPAAIRSFAVQLQADDMAQALRSTVLRVEFDGVETVWCPVGDFFGSGVGLNPYRDWWRTVEPGGVMAARWVMPFRRSCTVRLRNLGKEPVEATLGPLWHGPWRWDGRSLYFHANWRHEYPIRTRKEDGIDWNYIQIRGQGVYAGDMLAIHNGSARWWGEGDEKIFVDGERFPSHFGTGTEDYYGYSFGDLGTFFEAPFHAAPRAEGNRAPGHTTSTRTRSLDAIPFRRSLRFDMEIWHWDQTEVEYAAATYWYARPGATSNRKPEPGEAARPVLK
jgi:hypothetical protein